MKMLLIIQTYTANGKANNKVSLSFRLRHKRKLNKLYYKGIGDRKWQ